MPRPTRSHHRHQRPPLPPAGTPLHTPDDALRVVLAAIAQPPALETIVLLLDAGHRGGICLVCAGAATAGQVAALVPVLVQVAASEPMLAAVVVATVRPGHGVVVGPGDRVAFREMGRDLAAGGIELVDWFLLDGDVIASVAELTGAAWQWSSPEPRW